MTFRRAVVALACVVLVVLFTPWGGELAFLAGGGMVALGQRFQEARVGFAEGESPTAILATVLHDNQMSSAVRKIVPGRKTKPEVIAVMCMDPRLKDSFIFGDTRQMYDVLRVPGSVLSPEIIEAIELGVREHRVKVVLLTTHTDCAMEAVAHSEHAHDFPALSSAVHNREESFQALLSRPIIAKGIAEGTLRVERYTIDTGNGKLM